MSDYTIDVNGDGVVDASDDLNKDGRTDDLDVVAFKIQSSKSGGSPIDSEAYSPNMPSAQSEKEGTVIQRRGVSAPDVVGGGTRTVKKSKTSLVAAYEAGNLPAAQQSLLDSAYAKYKAQGGRSGKKSWWSSFVDAAANTTDTPFELVAAKYGTGTSPDIASTGSGLTKEEMERRYQLKLFTDAIKADPLADLSGTAGEIQDVLSQYADSMGLFKGRKEINSYVLQIMNQEKSTDVVADEMRKQAKALYPNFAERLDVSPDLTIRDLVKPYLEVMADTLEIDPNMVKLTDPTIQNAINGTKLRSLNDFRMDMRNDTRFATTRTAKREAADFAQSLLKGFGFEV